MKYLLLLYIIPVFMVTTSDSAKILAVFPVPSISHQVVFRPIMQELARRGHEVTVITTDPDFPKDKAPKNLTEINVHDLSYDLWETFYKLSSGSKDDQDTIQNLNVALQVITNVVVEQIKSPEISELLKLDRNYFDLVIVEAMPTAAYVYTHFFKAPAVMISSLGVIKLQLEMFGAPTHYTLYPTFLSHKLNYLSIWEKISTILLERTLSKMWEDQLYLEDEVLKKNFGPDVPSLQQLKNNFDMLFINEYPIWDSNRPVPPNVIYIGGLPQKPHNELPQDLKKYLDESKNGVIYISFGTNVNPSALLPEKMNIMIDVMSKLPYDILWKWDKEVMPGQSKNIKINKWFPQSDLLRHPSVKLFITQGGLQSTDEAIVAGVPLLGMPMLGDQWYNVEKYITLKIGKRLDMDTLTEEILRNTVEVLINDERLEKFQNVGWAMNIFHVCLLSVVINISALLVSSLISSCYRENIKDLRSKMLDQPMSSLDRTIWWIEYVIRHKGARHLRSPAAGISWSEYLELPLVLTVLSLSISVLVVIGLVISFVFRLLLSKTTKIKKS